MTVSRKYNKIWMGLATFLVVAGCFFSSCAVAAEKEIILDGEIYSSKQIIEDFIRSAFPAVQDRGALQKNSGGIYKKHYEGSYVESRIAWIKDLKDAQHPKQVLHKYMQKEIKIGFGWPPLQETDADYERFHDKYKIVKAQLEKMIPLLERATERHIVIIDRERETVKDYATVRIIFFENFFKDNRFKPDPHGGASPLNDETTARFVVKTLPHVDFTPSSRTGVGGYFLTDKDSQIMLSVCEIWPYFRHGLESGLVTECLLRSLGLVEPSENSGAALGNWNKAHDAHSKLKKRDGEGVNTPFIVELISLQKKHLSEMPSDHYGSIDDYPPYRKEIEEQIRYFPHDPTDADNRLFLPTEYDLAMLSLLYCEDIRVGDRKETVLKKLAEENTCKDRVFPAVK